MIIGMGRNGVHCSSLSKGSGNCEFEAIRASVVSALGKMFPNEKAFDQAVQLSRYDFIGVAGVIVEKLLVHFEEVLENGAR
jgi:hypothetical protein